jgi:hypothetical protein
MLSSRYAEQQDHDEPHLTNGHADWVDVSVPKLKCWISILILMGLKPLPHRRLYWDRQPYYGCPIISVAMQRARFEAIMRCIHLVNNETVVTDEAAGGYNKIAKVRWLIEEFARISQSLYNDERTCTVDEIMVPYKGRYCAIREYMKYKPVRFGIKLRVLASSQSWYLLWSLSWLLFIFNLHDFFVCTWEIPVYLCLEFPGVDHDVRAWPFC